MKDFIQLYSLATPNGQKVSIALEEMTLPYEAHKIDITQGYQFSDEFKKINPNSKIPAIIDPKPSRFGVEAAGAGPLAIMESGAILLYLAEKTGLFLPNSVVEKSRVMQWLFFQVGGIGPMFGQFGHFYRYATQKCDHPYPTERYTAEVRRLLHVIEKQLKQTEFIAGETLSIADFSIVPWVIALDKFYEARDHLEMDEFKKVQEWVEKIANRPKVISGMEVCGFS